MAIFPFFFLVFFRVPSICQEMDPRRKPQPLSFHLVLFIAFTCVCFRLIGCQDFDSFTKRVTFYPASLMISHNPKPLTFYHDTKLLNFHTVLNFTKLAKRFCMSNNSRSIFKERFFHHILETVRHFQKVSCRLLALPGFLTLIECDTYLATIVVTFVGTLVAVPPPNVDNSSILNISVFSSSVLHDQS